MRLVFLQTSLSLGPSSHHSSVPIKAPCLTLTWQQSQAATGRMTGSSPVTADLINDRHVAACSQCATSKFEDKNRQWRGELPLLFIIFFRALHTCGLRTSTSIQKRSKTEETRGERVNLPRVDGRMRSERTDPTWTAVALVISDWRQGCPRRDSSSSSRWADQLRFTGHLHKDPFISFLHLFQSLYNQWFYCFR